MIGFCTSQPRAYRVETSALKHYVITAVRRSRGLCVCDELLAATPFTVSSRRQYTFRRTAGDTVAPFSLVVNTHNRVS